MMASPILSASAGASAPVVPGPAMSQPVRVVISAAQRPDPYNPSTVGNPLVASLDAGRRATLTHHIHDIVAASGTVESDVDASDAVVADVSPQQLVGLAADPSLVVTPDVTVTMADASSGGPGPSSTPGPSTTPGPATTPGPTSGPAAPATRAPAAVFPQASNANALWKQNINGNNVTVAVLDTGIDKLADFGNRIIGGVDLSGEGNPYQDSFGHGTFVSGLIAGNGASSNGAYMGEAPNANLVAVKVAGASGQTDLATVIQGVNWAIANKAKYNISVLNMSLGAIPTSSTVTDPLDQAVESAWEAGITVVVSAGNSGPFNGTILSPGDDPLVITVGAIDDNGTGNSNDDSGASFSSVGPTSPDGWLKPDLVTSGRSVVSLRAPGSTIDTQNPTAEIGSGNFVGSGTSFSAAITSGAAALVIQADENAKKNGGVPSPDKVKGQLLGTASPGPVGNPLVDGHGVLNVQKAANQSGLQLNQTVPTSGADVGDTVSLYQSWQNSTWNPATWVGSTNPNGQALTLNNVVNLLSVSLGALTGNNSPIVNGSSWNGSTWNGSTWNGSSWNGSSWNGSSWNGSSWNGSSWNGSSWNGSSWNGSSWNGSSWN
jgi:serine protease AprX